MEPVSQRVMAFQGIMSNVLRFLMGSTYARRSGEPGISDFAVGNPHEMPLQGFVDALKTWTTPQDENWFAYKMSEPKARSSVAATLRQMRGIQFEDEDICMTNGGFAAITVALAAVVDPGDEVIFISPPWFFYEALIASNSGVPVRVKINPQTFD